MAENVEPTAPTTIPPKTLNASSTGVVMSEVLSYDDMGNISSLNRDGKGVSAYSYTGNRLNKVTGDTLTTDLYQYDLNGNAVFDGRNKVQLTYNQLNLPATATKTGLNLSYTYSADGIKLQKISNGTVRNYIDGIEYNGNIIDVIHTEDGLARNNGGTFSYEYNLNDHLGNVRYSFRKNTNNAIERIQSDDYYAFGLRKSSGSPVSLNDKYLYNGKEIQDELGGQYDYGARFYDPVIGRWNVVDPKAQLLEMSSPYVYALNSPTSFIDKDGELPIYIGGKTKYDSERNSRTYWDAQILATIAGSGIPNPGHRPCLLTAIDICIN
ncbi:RHS repeat-associated core domain-containing protein [Pedobacter gandavensis]|uniref:RHS repeat domain-containing protein n=1 Tax=Pedobacter gandavensis TaxID=2679963 RepID=UPI00292FE71B|nr:RHS repeat-associated core domain-containing protein [Pedobacter gandavensis]